MLSRQELVARLRNSVEKAKTLSLISVESELYHLLGDQSENAIDRIVFSGARHYCRKLTIKSDRGLQVTQVP